MYINGLVCFLLCRVLCSVNGLKWFCLPFQCFCYKVSFWDVKMWIWLEGPRKLKASQKLTSLDCLTSSNSKQTSNCFDFVTWPFICISVLVFIRALFIWFSVVLFYFIFRVGFITGRVSALLLYSYTAVMHLLCPIFYQLSNVFLKIYHFFMSFVICQVCPEWSSLSYPNEVGPSYSIRWVHSLTYLKW